jgi:hypothetical protein
MAWSGLSLGKLREQDGVDLPSYGPAVLFGEFFQGRDKMKVDAHLRLHDLTMGHKAPLSIPEW